MAVVGDRKAKFEKELANIGFEELSEEEKQNQQCRLRMLITEEEEKMRKYKDENIRRRHNYTPFIVELVKVLAKEQKLTPLLEMAIRQAEERKKAVAK